MGEWKKLFTSTRRRIMSRVRLAIFSLGDKKSFSCIIKSSITPAWWCGEVTVETLWLSLNLMALSRLGGCVFPVRQGATSHEYFEDLVVRLVDFVNLTFNPEQRELIRKLWFGTLEWFLVLTHRDKRKRRQNKPKHHEGTEPILFLIAVVTVSAIDRCTVSLHGWCWCIN